MDRYPAKATPRITSTQAPKFIGKLVTVIGEVTSITPHANTLTLKMPDDENIIVLLNNNNSTLIEPHLLTEVSGKLVSRGQIESVWIKQYSSKQTAQFNKSLYIEACQFLDAYADHFYV